MRNVAPCSLTPEGGRTAKNKLALDCPAIQEAAIGFEPNAAP